MDRTRIFITFENETFIPNSTTLTLDAKLCIWYGGSEFRVENILKIVKKLDGGRKSSVLKENTNWSIPNWRILQKKSRRSNFRLIPIHSVLAEVMKEAVNLTVLEYLVTNKLINHK